MENYVLNHDYGYGKLEEQEIKKLELRNFKDLQVYVDDVLANAFIVKVQNNKVYFLEDNQSAELILKKYNKFQMKITY